MGALKGVKDKDKKEAAEGAAMAALTAYLIERAAATSWSCRKA